MKVTVSDIMSKKPCKEWTEERVQGYIGDGKTLRQILKIKEIPEQDRIWCITRFLDDKTNREFAIWCARQCKTDVKEIIEYINVIERYYDGKATKEELEAADSAAYSAAYRAAYRAAYNAAYWAADWAADCAAYSAADRAANSAADRAAYWAADSAADWAANSAAYNDMRKKQIEKLLEYCR